MLSISPPASGAGKGNYYLNLAREDYYTGGGEPPGQWFGRGAEDLGLAGTVNATELHNLMEGFDPSGQNALVQNAGKENRQSFWDLTFSAPKRVSVAWSQASPEISREIQSAQKEAVRAALRYLEENCAETRRGKGGLTIEKANLVFATFEHGTSRALDPQLHTHCLLQNLGFRQDGTVGTINTHVIFKHKMAIGALYRAELSAQLERRLGLLSERKGKAFELKGVPEELIREFSKRRQAIEEELKERGYFTSKASDVATLNTRDKKESVSREQLFAEWQQIGQQYRWSKTQIENLCAQHAPERDIEREKAEAVAGAVNEITNRQSFFSEKELVRFVAEESQGRGVGAKEVLDAISSTLSASPEIVSLGRVKDERVYSTKEILRMEKELLKTAIAGKNDGQFVVPTKTVERVLESNKTISDEQREAVIHVTTALGRVQILAGRAGTGKSFTLRTARECWESGGFRVIGAALAGKAAQGLYEGSGIKSATLHRLLGSIEAGTELIDSKTIVVIDEAAMVGTKQLSRLIKAVDAGGGKLVLVGDERQLQSIEAGGAFVAIARNVGSATLTENRRQEEDWTKRAVELFSRGHASTALMEYAQRGYVTIKGDRYSVMDSLVDDWARKGIKNPKDNLILASEKREVYALNKLSQLRRKEELGESSVRANGQELYQGDRVLITRNSRILGVRNGQLGTVRSVNKQFHKVTVSLDSGNYVSLNLKTFPHVELGYAVTTHKAQGMTAKDAYVLAGGAMQDRELTYVQASRGKGVTRFYLTEADTGPELRDISRQMSKSNRKELALSVLAPEKKLDISF